MLFVLKKVLQAILLPHTLLLILLIISLILTFRKKRFGKILLVISLVLSYGLSITPGADLLMKGLENRYISNESFIPKVQYIVVLGGGAKNPLASLPVTSRLGLNASTTRLLEGMRLLDQQEDSILVLSGGGWSSRKLEVTSAQLMKEQALLLGINRDRIILEAKSRDTYEQAKTLMPRLKDKPFLLVTSAFHMPRSMYIFRKVGMRPIAAPADFRAQRRRGYRFIDFLPHPANLHSSVFASKEYMGLLFYRIF